MAPTEPKKIAVIAKGKKIKVRVNGMKSKENPKTVNKKSKRI